MCARHGVAILHLPPCQANGEGGLSAVVALAVLANGRAGRRGHNLSLEWGVIGGVAGGMGAWPDLNPVARHTDNPALRSDKNALFAAGGGAELW